MRRRAFGTSGGAAGVLVCEYLLTDGPAKVESFAGAQTTDASVCSLAVAPGNGADLLIDDIDDFPSFQSGGALTGGLALASFPIEVGQHSDTSALLPFTGRLARWIVDSRHWTFEQNRLLFRALTTPHLLWGQCAPNAATEPNRGPVALPIVRVMSGSGALAISPNAIDPDGTIPTLISTTSPVNGGSVTIINQIMQYTPPPSFIGRDQFSYTISDGMKQSTSWVAIDINSTSLNAVDDAWNLPLASPLSHLTQSPTIRDQAHSRSCRLRSQRWAVPSCFPTILSVIIGHK